MPAFLLRRTLLAAVLYNLIPCRLCPDPGYPARANPLQSSSRLTTASTTIRREVMIPMRDGVKLHTVILVPKGAKNAPILLTRTPYNANVADDEHAELASGLEPLRLRQRDRRHRRRRLHPRDAGCARQVRLRGRLCDEPPAARPAESDPGRPCHRHLRHHRLAGEEHAGEQRQGRHHRHLL